MPSKLELEDFVADFVVLFVEPRFQQDLSKKKP